LHFEFICWAESFFLHVDEEEQEEEQESAAGARRVHYALGCKSVTVSQHGRTEHGRGSGSSTTSSSIQWMDGAPVGAESLWPSVIRWKSMFRHPVDGWCTDGC